jgi:hypothetical protein
MVGAGRHARSRKWREKGEKSVGNEYVDEILSIYFAHKKNAVRADGLKVVKTGAIQGRATGIGSNRPSRRSVLRDGNRE